MSALITHPHHKAHSAHSTCGWGRQSLCYSFTSSPSFYATMPSESIVLTYFHSHCSCKGTWCKWIHFKYSGKRTTSTMSHKREANAGVIAGNRNASKSFSKINMLNYSKTVPAAKTDLYYDCWGSQAAMGVATPRGVPHVAGGAAEGGAWLPPPTPHPPIDDSSNSDIYAERLANQLPFNATDRSPSLYACIKARMLCN